MTLFEVSIDIVAAFLAALLALWFVAVRHTGQTRHPENPVDEASTVLLFDGDALADATSSGASLLDGVDGETDWVRLEKVLEGRYPGFPEAAEALLDEPFTVLDAGAVDDSSQLRIEQFGRRWRVELIEPSIHNERTPAYVHQARKTSQELDTLRQAMEGAPNPVWKTDSTGKTTWFNAAYADLFEKVHGDDNPIETVLFSGISDSKLASGKVRYSVLPKGGSQQLWFEVSMVVLEGSKFFYAESIDAAVTAEMAQRNFVQTLAKTFAQLSIGLAIFDRNRQLVLFNPALVDLTDLSAEFLSSRPNLLTFFDKLRDNQMMPEPKNYTSWRDRIAELVAQASDGKYLETWTLASGQTYRVNGRPHPDGAIAFLFEDISAEVSLTRRFRAELEMSQSMLDAIDSAIAVFSPSGVLTHSNKAYRDMWMVDPESSFVDMTVVDATSDWKNGCEASPIWADIREFVMHQRERGVWDADVQKLDGQPLACTVSPLPSNASMVQFSNRAVRVEEPSKDQTAVKNLKGA
jgi:PAS domain-containing protein